MQIDKTKFKGKLLFFDIETSLLEVYTHYIGSQCSIYHNQIKTEKKVICISYMEEGWKKPITLVWENGSDIQLLKDFKKIADQYPVLVAQNGDKFDIKVLNGRMWMEQLEPFTNILSLDTLKMSRGNMKLNSHKLDYKLKVLGDAGKNPMEFEDWVAVQNGNDKALKKMVKYCEKDVTGLRKVFWSLVPYVTKLPIHMGVLLSGDRDSCPTCSSTSFIKDGTRPSPAGRKQRFLCKECGHKWTDSRLLKE